MDNNELDNVEQSSEVFDKEQVGIVTGIIGCIIGIVMAIKTWKISSELKKEREKNSLYQEAIRKHQAEINALKNDIEREEYKNRLWEELKVRSEK